MVPRPRFDEHEDPADFNPDHDVDFLNTRARHRDLVLRLKGAQGGATRDRPWRSEAAAPPPPTPAVERLQRSAPPKPRQFARPNEVSSEPLPSVEQIRASLPARPKASSPSESRLAAQARAARLRAAGGSTKADDSLAQIRRSHREVEEDFAERRLRVAREERAARAADRAADRRADEASRRKAAADRRAAEEQERKSERAAAEVARLAAQKEEKERRRLQVEAAAEARRRKEREDEAEAMRIWNELREREKSNAREMERRSQSQPKNKGVRFDRSARNRTSSYETLETYGTAGTTDSSGMFDLSFWMPNCGTDFADSFAERFGNGSCNGGCVDGWLDNLFGGDNTSGTDRNGSPNKTGGASKNKGSPGSPTSVAATKVSATE
jgi:hypothetical protein